PGDFRAVVTDAPNAARRMIAVDVRAVKLGERAAVIDHAARHRTGFAVVMLGRRRRQRLRTHRAVGIEDVAPLIDAPAKIIGLANKIDLLPEILAVVADPDVPGLWIARQPPRIAKAISPRFGNDALLSDERIVRRHAV